MRTISFVFSGSRKKLLEEIERGESPDTQLYGMNHLSSDFQVVSKEIENKFMGFRLRHTLSFFMVRKADIVFGSSLFYMLPFKKIFGARGKFVLFNISLNRFLDKKSNSIFYGIILWLLREVDMIVSLSHAQNASLREKHGIPLDKLRFVPLGVDTKFYQPVFTGRANYVLSVGRDNGRDYKTVVETARRLPDREFHLVLSQRNLEGITDIPDNVKVFFDLSKMELNKKYREAQLLLLITHKDNFGDGSDCSGQTVLLDAFATGVPVIATKKSYIKDYAHEGEHLLLVDFYDSSAIMEAMKKIEVSGEDMARRARTLVEQNFSTQKMGEKLCSII